ncbi:MAG TPA: ABC transporter permease [Cytophagales bacterium]|jgi:putative ABC transport system permease protein
MNLTENIKEGLRSVQGNALRTVLTALIIAIGIMSLVGILTAIEGIRASVNSSFSSLGANAFDIQSTRPWRRARAGVNEKVYPPMEYRQAARFKRMFEYPADITLYTGVSGTAEVKYKSKKTNPNARVMGGDENYLSIKDYKLESGRGFSQNELERAAWVVIIGQEIKTTLFDRIDPLNQYISVLGGRYKVVGVLEKQGGMMGSSADRMILLPLETARRVAGGQDLTYDITVAVKDPTQLETIMGEATGLMRLIRRDPPGQPESFEIKASESLASRLDNIAGYLRIGGGVVGFITLLGASIGLMNIMLVSVTERTREIGIRKALGATPLRIRQQFLIEAIVICLLGGIAGVIFGLLVGNLLSSLISSGGFVVPWLWIMVGLVVCVVVGLLSGYYPAYRASRLDPIESLRFE